MKQPSGLPIPADVIAQGKGKTVLVTIPAPSPAKKMKIYTTNSLLFSWIGYSGKPDCIVGCHSCLNIQGYATIKREIWRKLQVNLSWRNLNWTWAQDSFTCPANKACRFLTFPFYGQNLLVCQDETASVKTQLKPEDKYKYVNVTC